MNVSVEWKGNLTFEATAPSGVPFVMDASHDNESAPKGPTPLEVLVASLAACSAVDVVGILAKKRQIVESYRIEVEGTRPEPGTYPRPFTALTVRHILTGQNLDPVAVERAVSLSDEKYCSVAATLRQQPTISTEIVIE
ncbi:MAG: OsmC family protein [Fimbriimonas sp.]|jgi:putative redox protein|nr:OsmC family protein [Fimbriimonas sp.]